ncbi:MAG: asparagine synthase C-terminal domain-containing protein, partial [Anaerolineales bacterium]|nr:asparagine synthase C-terminal domain-containing protein [Anaerolineales bacterium]
QDEAADARRFAEHLDLDFRLQNVSGEQMLALVEAAWEAQTEPFADYSILPTLMVSRFARQSLTVALSGDGGDELFFGYERPRSLLRNGADFRFPWAIRYGLYAAGRLGVGPRRSEAIAARSPGDYYFNVNCRMSEADLKLLAPALPGLPPDFGLYQFGAYQGVEDLADYSRYVEFYGQLQRGLKKVDLASMHCSLEVRVPLLDREVVDTSLRIRPSTHMHNGERKYVLRRLLERYVPKGSLSTAKRGFAVPLGDWLRGPMRPMAEEMLFGNEMYPLGLFDQQALRAYWQAHLAGEKDHKWGLWNLLALQGWAQKFL